MDRQLIAQLYNDNDTALAGLGQVKPEQVFIKDFFSYNAKLDATLAAGANLDANTRIQADSDFLIQKMTFKVVDDADNVVLNPDLDIQIDDQGSGRKLFDIATPIDAVAGTGELPQILTTPKLLVNSSNIVTSFSNTSPTNYAKVQLTFIGTKLFVRR